MTTKDMKENALFQRRLSASTIRPRITRIPESRSFSNITLPPFLPSFGGLPKLYVAELVDIVEGIVAPAGGTRNLIRFQVAHHGCVRGTLFKRARPGMAVQAFPVVVGLVKADGVHRRSKPVDIDVVQPFHLGMYGAKHGVIGMAGVAGLVRGDSMILEMSSGDIGLVVHVQAPPVGFHDVARKAEL